MKTLLCFAAICLVFLVISPMAGAVQHVPLSEDASFLPEPSSFLLIGFALLAVGIVGTRALRG